MTLQKASDAKAASDIAAIRSRAVLTSLTMIAINATITSQSTRIDLDERSYKATIVFKAICTNSIIEIIQSDDTKILLVDIVGALTDNEYRVATKLVKANRVGINDKLKLQIAWN